MEVESYKKNLHNRENTTDEKGSSEVCVESAGEVALKMKVVGQKDALNREQQFFESLQNFQM